MSDVEKLLWLTKTLSQRARLALADSVVHLFCLDRMLPQMSTKVDIKCLKNIQHQNIFTKAQEIGFEILFAVVDLIFSGTTDTRYCIGKKAVDVSYTFFFFILCKHTFPPRRLHSPIQEAPVCRILRSGGATSVYLDCFDAPMQLWIDISSHERNTFLYWSLSYIYCIYRYIWTDVLGQPSVSEAHSFTYIAVLLLISGNLPSGLLSLIKNKKGE